MTGEQLEKIDPVSAGSARGHKSMNLININYIVFPIVFFAVIALIALVVAIYIEELMGVKADELLSIFTIFDWTGKISTILLVLWSFIGSFIYLVWIKSRRDEYE